MSADLLYSDTEDALRDSVRSLLAARCSTDRVTAMYDGDESLAVELWAVVAGDLDLPGLGLAEGLGGGGAAPREVAVAMEELGRCVAPLPFLTSSVIAGTVLQACGADDLVSSLVDGSRIAALVVPFDAYDSTVPATVTASGDGRVSGTVRAVAGAGRASVLVVPAVDDGVLTLRVVMPDEHTAVAARTSLDMSRPIADVTFTDAASTEIARGEQAAAALDAGLLRGAAMLASEQLGVAEWCLETTLAYVKDRKQFGRPVGSFQAIKHRLARLYVAISSARAAARNAAVLVDEGGPSAVAAVSLAQAFCSDVAVLAAEECVQMHGGIGMTWEHPAHLYLKRAKADQVALGTPAHHRAILARVEGL